MSSAVLWARATSLGATTTAQLVWILAARLPGPEGEAVLSRAIDSMGAEREDGIP
jgi:hypothetical protein